MNKWWFLGNVNCWGKWQWDFFDVLLTAQAVLLLAFHFWDGYWKGCCLKCVWRMRNGFFSLLFLWIAFNMWEKEFHITCHGLNYNSNISILCSVSLIITKHKWDCRRMEWIWCWMFWWWSFECDLKNMKSIRFIIIRMISYHCISNISFIRCVKTIVNRNMG